MQLSVRQGVSLINRGTRNLASLYALKGIAATPTKGMTILASSKQATAALC